MVQQIPHTTILAAAATDSIAVSGDGLPSGSHLERVYSKGSLESVVSGRKLVHAMKARARCASSPKAVPQSKKNVVSCVYDKATWRKAVSESD